MPKTFTVPPPPPHNEGKTVAAWTLNMGVVLGAVLIAAGMVTGGNVTLIAVGAGVIVLAVVVGAVLSLAGFGKKRAKARA